MALKTKRYSGKEKDATGLYYYGARYFDPTLMRWLSPDPIGPVDGPNIYLFLNSNPINSVDLNGNNKEEFYLITAHNNAADFVSWAAGIFLYNKNYRKSEPQVKFINEKQQQDFYNEAHRLVETEKASKAQLGEQKWNKILTPVEKLRYEILQGLEKISSIRYDKGKQQIENNKQNHHIMTFGHGLPGNEEIAIRDGEGKWSWPKAKDYTTATIQGNEPIHVSKAVKEITSTLGLTEYPNFNVTIELYTCHGGTANRLKSEDIVNNNAITSEDDKNSYAARFREELNTQVPYNLFGIIASPAAISVIPRFDADPTEIESRKVPQPDVENKIEDLHYYHVFGNDEPGKYLKYDDNTKRIFKEKPESIQPGCHGCRMF